MSDTGLVMGRIPSAIIIPHLLADRFGTIINAYAMIPMIMTSATNIPVVLVNNDILMYCASIYVKNPALSAINTCTECVRAQALILLWVRQQEAVPSLLRA